MRTVFERNSEGGMVVQGPTSLQITTIDMCVLSGFTYGIIG